jgi:nicotinamide mononucleotide (NMN) deamidase PncC
MRPGQARGESILSDVDNVIPELVTAIHARPEKAVIVVTGAGISALGWLFDQGGASRTVLEGRVPYSISSLNEFVGVEAETHVSRDEAVRMADNAYERALHLRAEDDVSPVIGVSCTATIATDYSKRGTHRASCALRTATRRTDFTIEFDKGARDRIGEEDVTSRLVLNLVALGNGVVSKLDPGLLPGENLNVTDERL